MQALPVQAESLPRLLLLQSEELKQAISEPAPARDDCRVDPVNSQVASPSASKRTFPARVAATEATKHTSPGASATSTRLLTNSPILH